MKNKKKFLLILLVAILILAAGTSAIAAKPPIQDDEVVWQLTRPKVIDPGKTETIREGTLITGFIIEAKAKSRHQNLIKNGTFRLELSAFSPKRDMPRQKAGRWYLQGRWVIDANGNPAAVKERHKPGTAQGFIEADLDFNPTAEARNWTASAVLPMSTADARWLKGEGVYSVNAAWEGDLFLQLELWPQAQQ